MNKSQNQPTELDVAVCGRLGAIVRRLRKYNAWRRGADIEQPDPRQIGADIDDAILAINLMRAAIRKTLDQNRNLADGDDCTLRHPARLFDSA